ncbi:aminotransferase class I/II-fold pyridoxal phosphate-dependent enzyme [Duganella sp. BJB488]|uniref:pyridoxal phosphate-dependent aminotransferase n=1 Tax=unclassified Duganella TaxID=2636909 RepID=UPI000E34EFA1|nr:MULTISPECIES: aminotransferase class I/II-fold pyridoxal phosphate-dependent enzyme [unclassified Duganella]RFP21904.1 aminotransferase class I/II-fold pyridoxal phosphate-dependent enzyme [Duganella sp. BJB489]RFP23695.1 aminotransferase class I/II-fold pyridoxal phosphate-dependent enzyme [Duganella sp. BJB488]RFP38863.1 aminotransferase class I/II-fold pyridoxal phosphate-dependent enzyme [Duganella sp. BJB480]
MELSQRIARSRPLATTAMHGRVDAMKARGEDVIDFSIAISHFPAPQSVLQATHDALSQPALPYTTVGGDAGIRARLAAKVVRENGIAATADEVIVTNGAKQALYQALYVMANPGDAVIIFKPHWPAYVTTCKLLGLVPVLVDLPATVTADFLASLPPARILIINNPHNPTGGVLSADEIERIAAWLKRTGTRAIVDESYEKLIFEGAHTSLAARPDWRDIGIVTLYSASQSYAMMGWRAGFAVAPAHVVTAMETLQGPITAAAPMLIQLALAAAFESGEPAAMLAEYRQRRNLVLDLVHGLPWLTMHCPASGPYLWGDISALTMDSNQFAEQLLNEYSVALMPGEALGAPGFIRIGYISDDIATLRRGVQAIIRFGNARYRSR